MMPAVGARCELLRIYLLETVWKIGRGCGSGFRKQPRGVEGAPIGRFLPPNKPGREAFGYFPNSFSRDCLESSWTGRIARLSVARSAEKGVLLPVLCRLTGP